MTRKKTRKRYTAETKHRAIAFVVDSGYTAVRAAKRCGVNPNTLRDWVRQSRSEQKPVEVLDESIDIREVHERGFEAHQRYLLRNRSRVRDIAPRLIASVNRRPERDHIFAIDIPKNVYRVIVKTKLRKNAGEESIPMRRITHNPYTNELVLSDSLFPSEFRDGVSVLNIYALERDSKQEEPAEKALVETVLGHLSNKLPGMISRALTEALR